MPMFGQSVVWGVDIGDYAIKAVKLKKTPEGIEIVSFDVVEYGAGIEEDEDRSEHVRRAVAAFHGRNKVASGEKVVVSISSQSAFYRFIPLPPVEKKRIPEIVKYEARQQIPFPIDEVSWDYEIVTPVVEPGEEIKVALVAVKSQVIRSFLSTLQSSHLKVDIVQVALLALYNFIRYDQDFSKGTVAIDVGAGNTDLVVVDADNFWTRNLPLSGNDMTRALQDKFQIPFEEAEDLKKKSGQSKQAAKLFGVMRPVLSNLIGEVQRSIGYFKSQNRKARIENVVLFGNTLKLKAVDDYFVERLDYNVQTISSLDKVKIASEVDAPLFKKDLPGFAVAIGLGIQGLGEASVNMNMLPTDLTRKREMSKKKPFILATAACLFICLLFSFLSKDRLHDQLYAARQDAPEVIRKLDEVSAQYKQHSNVSGIESKLTTISKVGYGRDTWIDIVTDLSACVPPEIWLLSMQSEDAGEIEIRVGGGVVEKEVESTGSSAAPAPPGGIPSPGGGPGGSAPPPGAGTPGMGGGPGGPGPGGPGGPGMGGGPGGPGPGGPGGPGAGGPGGPGPGGPGGPGAGGPAGGGPAGAGPPTLDGGGSGATTAPAEKPESGIKKVRALRLTLKGETPRNILYVKDKLLARLNKGERFAGSAKITASKEESGGAKKKGGIGEVEIGGSGQKAAGKDRTFFTVEMYVPLPEGEP